MSMWLDGSAQEAVNLFWESCGEEEPFPRNLERPVALALPVALIRLPRLTLDDVEGWSRRRGAALRFGCESRPIRGCVVGYRGCGLIFVDGADPDDERRFTLAHEAAHFMIDYWLPRQLAIRKLGLSITDVLDGLREPTLSEKVHAFLGGASMEVYTQLMERDEVHGYVHSKVWSAEDKADRVAMALLAPPETVLAEVDVSAARFDERHSVMQSVLSVRFGLPTYMAASYGFVLLTDIGLGPSWVEDISGSEFRR
ncbi:MAG: ImmA/IrrE family metallo-endopeptidase [Blastocatellia bacterium]